MDVRADFSDVQAAFSAFEAEVAQETRNVGERAVGYAKEHGTYRDRTGRLRSSNKYKADKNGLELYNDAEYASNVEAKGYEVLSGAALHAESELKEIFE